MKTNKHKVKIRFLRGGTVDIIDTINPVLKRAKFHYLTVYVETNAISTKSLYILNKLIQLKSLIIKSDKN